MKTFSIPIKFRKYIFVLCFLTFNIPVFSNLMPTPQVYVNELFFNFDSDWFIELRYINPKSYQTPIDSLFLSSSSGKSKINIKIPQNSEGYILLNSDSLFSEVNINPLGDLITIVVYFRHGERVYDDNRGFIFGNYKNAYAPAPENGKSVGLIAYFGYVLIPPSLGLWNGTGLYGTLKGKLYDQNKNLITNGSFWLNQDFIINVDSTGRYWVSLFQHDYNFNKIYYSLGAISNTVDIEPIRVTIEPNIEIEKDIYIKNVLLEIFYVENKKELVYINPNPANIKSKIWITTNIPLNSAELLYEIYNIQGIKVGQGKIERNGIWLKLPPTLREGIHFFRFIMDGHLIQTSKLLVTYNP